MKSKFKTSFLAIITISFTVCLMIFPDQSLSATLRGLFIWGEIVFPSLLPFFIAAELLISFGVVQLLGVFFEPIMRPLFNVSGAGSFAWIVGMISGFPSGAKITVSLREKKEITQLEAERLITFTNAASPLFIFGVIAVGFLNNEKLGILIAFTHYITNIIVGMLMSFHGGNANERSVNSYSFKQLRYAFRKMHLYRIKEQRPFGKIMSDAVINSVQTLIIIGGFIMFFSVLTNLLQFINFFKILELFLSPVFNLLHLPINTIIPLLTGLFEITMGAQLITNIIETPILIQLILISFILGFNGFSIHAQVASLLVTTDIRYLPYFIARVLHAFFASFATYVFYFLLGFHEQTTIKTAQLSFNDNQQYVLTTNGFMITFIFIAITFFLFIINIVKKQKFN